MADVGEVWKEQDSIVAEIDPGVYSSLERRVDACLQVRSSEEGPLFIIAHLTVHISIKLG